MRILLFLALFSAIAAAASTAPAQSRDYPYCLQGRSAGYPGDCRFVSFQQCQASASGTGDGCGRNPRVTYTRRRAR